MQRAPFPAELRLSSFAHATRYSGGTLTESTLGFKIQEALCASFSIMEVSDHLRRCFRMGLTPSQRIRELARDSLAIPPDPTSLLISFLQQHDDVPFWDLISNASPGAHLPVPSDTCDNVWQWKLMIFKSVYRDFH